MAYYNDKQQIEEQGPTTEQKVDCIFAQIISTLFSEGFYDPDFGPGDFIMNFELTTAQYELICRDPRGGIDGFQTRVLDVMETAIKDLSIFNGQPTSEITVMTNIFDVIEFEDGEDEYPYVFKIGLKRNNDE